MSGGGVVEPVVIEPEMLEFDCPLFTPTKLTLPVCVLDDDDPVGWLPVGAYALISTHH